MAKRGQWEFVLFGDPSTINVKEYQQELLKISQQYQNDLDIDTADWFNPTEYATEPQDNVFAEIIYWHQDEPGVMHQMNAKWMLYWDPTKFKKGRNSWSCAYSKLIPTDFINKAVAIQRQLAISFPEHFKLYLGEPCNKPGSFYWGVQPESPYDLF